MVWKEDSKRSIQCLYPTVLISTGNVHLVISRMYRAGFLEPHSVNEYCHQYFIVHLWTYFKYIFLLWTADADRCGNPIRISPRGLVPLVHLLKAIKCSTNKTYYTSMYSGAVMCVLNCEELLSHRSISNECKSTTTLCTKASPIQIVQQVFWEAVLD